MTNHPNPSGKTQSDTVEDAGWPDAECSLLSRTLGPCDGNEAVTMATVDEDGDLKVMRKRRRGSEDNAIIIGKKFHGSSRIT